MKNLNQKLGEMEYDGLIAGLTPKTQVGGGIIRKLTGEAAVLKRGTILAKSSGTAGDGKLVVLGTEADADETLTPDCVLCDDIEVGTAEDEAVPVYTAGSFNTGKVVVKDGYTITDADKDALRMRDIVLKAVSE